LFISPLLVGFFAPSHLVAFSRDLFLVSLLLSFVLPFAFFSLFTLLLLFAFAFPPAPLFSIFTFLLPSFFQFPLFPFALFPFPIFPFFNALLLLLLLFRF